MNLTQCVQATLIADEIGIVSARLGNGRLSSCFTPLYRHEGDLIEPHAVRASLTVTCNGEPVSPARFFEALPQAERVLADTAARAVHIANLAIFDPMPGAAAVVDFDLACAANANLLADAVEAVHAVAQLVHLDLDRLILSVRVQGADDLARASLMAAAGPGWRLAVSGFTGTPEEGEAIDMLSPLHVGFSARFFRAAALSPARSLLRPAAASLRDRGIMPIIGGIDDIRLFRHALSLGPILMSGRFLGASIAVGDQFERTQAFSPATPESDGNVIRLFA